jgi:hypothetical protein
VLGDKTSPILYGYDQNALAVLIKNGPVLSVGGGGFGGFGGGGRGGRGGGLPPGVGGGELQPMSAPAQLTTLDGGAAPAPPGTVGAGGGRGGRGGGGGFAGGAPGVAPPAAPPAGAPAGAAAAGAGAAGGGGRGGGGGGGRGGGGRGGAGGGAPAVPTGPRVLLTYPNDPNDLLLSGELVGGENLAGNAVLVDSPLGKGHVVLFANRPFWRNEPHGNYFLWFNAMLNWDHLNAGR